MQRAKSLTVESGFECIILYDDVIQRVAEMNRELMSARLSADVMAAARARAEVDRQNLTEVVERALVKYLGMGYGDSKGPDLAARVADIEQRLSQLEVSGQASKARGKGRR